MIGKETAELPGRAKTIGLCMIVKNETNVIRQCLESTLPLVDYILVVDTGSTDGTQQMIRGFLAGHKGAVIDEPWRDFAYNRSFALERLREVAHVDYALVIDADETLELDAGFDPISFKAHMSHDLYDVPIRDGNITYRPQLFSNRMPFSFKGVLHEYLQAPEGNIRRTTAEGFAIRASSDGGVRSNNPSKYQDDAAVLERALANETDPFLISRYTFYLAQSYRDCDEKQKAVKNYLRRAEQGFWIEEVFISLYEAAKLQEALQLPFDEILATYLRASTAVPSRAEALHGASRLCRNASRPNEGYEIAKKGLALTQPPNGLCVEPWIYDYGLLDEFTVNAYWAGHYRDCLEKCLELFARANLPPHYTERIAANARSALAKIADKSSHDADILLWPTGSIASGIAMAAPSLMPRANSDLVTVITPTRDRSQLLRRALKYFREQDYKNIEWQILDDSTSSADWANDVIDGNIFYERVDKQMTVGEKRNYLVDKARGDIIVQFDDDDYYAPNYVSSMVSTLGDRGADLINLRGWFVYDVRSHFFGYWDLMHKHGLHYRCDPAGVSLRILKQNDSDWADNHMGFGFSYAFKKRVHKEVKFPHVNFNEDATFYLNAASSFKTDGIHDTKGICLHILHEVSTSRCFPQYHLPQFVFDQLFSNVEYLCKSKPEEPRSKFGDNMKAAYPENKQWGSTPIGLNSSAAATAGRAPEATVIEKDRVEQMPFRAKTIGLCMIVKNETKVIRQCLESTLPLIDYILIVDTGSTDGTQEMIRDFLAHHSIEGTVIDEPWRDFAYNRSFALERLREVAQVDYALVIDADDSLELDVGFDPTSFKAQMSHDLYDVQIRHGSITHYRPQLFSNRLPFSFKGVLHEYLQAPEGNISRTNAEGFAICASSGGGFRSNNPSKYQDDAAVLERALANETDPFLISRYIFYLAQSYRDFGEKEKAVTNYLKRADLGFWNEEIYVSLLEAGNLMAALERPFEEVIAAWERATQAVPARAEALHAASRYCRDKGKNAEGMEFARRGIDLVQPSGLFVQPWVYEYGILDEFAVNAYWAGAYRESLDASLKLLASDKLPSSIVKRIVANARFAAERIPVTNRPNLGSLGAEDLVTQHKLVPQRSLQSRVNGHPLVMIAILAEQKEATLPLYLDCIEALDYPKSRIVLYIRTNNNTDNTEQILREWVSRIGHTYYKVEFNANDVPDRVDQYPGNGHGKGAMGQIRNASLRRATELECEFYFVADMNSLVRRCTLRELVALNLPIVAPFLRSISPAKLFSNYHAEVDPSGYYKECDQYHWILARYIRGLIEVPVVNLTYLVRCDVISKLTYGNRTDRHEYVVFSNAARQAQIPQYLDNRQVYGYIAFEGELSIDNGIERARALLQHQDRGSPQNMETIDEVRCGMLDYHEFPELRESWGGPFNGQAHRRQMFAEIVEACKPAAIVETGTFRGVTTEFMAKFSRVPVHTVESSYRQFGYARERFKDLANVHLVQGDSRRFLMELFGANELPRGCIFFYLDAHWGEDLPLAEELNLIFEACAEAIVMIDDFKVPGDAGYAYDDYGPCKALTADYIAELTHKFSLAHFYPATPSSQETGARRGSIVLAAAPALAEKLSGMASLRRDESLLS